MTEFTWECSCGHIEYSDIAPDECPSCFKIDSFTQLPEELMVEREKDKAEEELEMPIKSSKVEKPSKPKLKKPGRKKKK